MLAGFPADWLWALVGFSCELHHYSPVSGTPAIYNLYVLAKCVDLMSGIQWQKLVSLLTQFFAISHIPGTSMPIQICTSINLVANQGASMEPYGVLRHFDEPL